MTARLYLHPDWFSDTERLVAETAGMRVTAFRFPSGVAALRVTNERGEIVILPYQGQQIWSATFDGRNLTMGSMFHQPIPTRNYLETYGAFFIHCGMTAIGAPGEGDDHVLHGEIPNAPFADAVLEFSEDGGVRVLGQFTYTKAFAHNYTAHASVSLGPSDTLIDVSIEVQNHKHTPMDLMYLGHANFRPVDDGQLVYSATYDANHVRVRRSIPAHISPPEGYRELLEQLADDPTESHVLRPDMTFDPEVVFTLDMQADDNGFAHAMQRHPDGHADYIRFRPDQTPMATRWICRTADQQGLGMAFPSTSEVEGYSAEKAKGQYVELAGGDSWRCDIRLGALNAADAADMARHIDYVCGR
ncbi:MAG: DUF4432 family protein [Pseudomonadota bacterium]